MVPNYPRPPPPRSQVAGGDWYEGIKGFGFIMHLLIAHLLVWATSERFLLALVTSNGHHWPNWR